MDKSIRRNKHEDMDYQEGGIIKNEKNQCKIWLEIEKLFLSNQFSLNKTISQHDNFIKEEQGSLMPHSQCNNKYLGGMMIRQTCTIGGSGSSYICWKKKYLWTKSNER